MTTASPNWYSIAVLVIFPHILARPGQYLSHFSCGLLEPKIKPKVQVWSATLLPVQLRQRRFCEYTTMFEAL